MENIKPISTTIFQDGQQSKEKSTNVPIQSIMKSFEEEHMNLYWAEKALANSIPKIIK